MAKRARTQKVYLGKIKRKHPRIVLPKCSGNFDKLHVGVESFSQRRIVRINFASNFYSLKLTKRVFLPVKMRDGLESNVAHRRDRIYEYVPIHRACGLVGRGIFH